MILYDAFVDISSGDTDGWQRRDTQPSVYL